MNYREALEYIESTSQYGSVLGLESIRVLLKKLDNPQKELKFVHIAGTNGKGSTLSFISTVLKEAGYRVGRYISPTIFEYRERIQINEAYISKADLGRYMTRVKEACDSMVAEQMAHPTPFEIETALSFLYFKEKKCDIVVLETGLGGTLDATNIIENTLVAVIASISMDHMAFLGDTLEKIAENKAGIIKNNCYVISTNQEDAVIRVLKAKAEEKGAEFSIADTTKVKSIKTSLKKQSFSYQNYKKIEISLLGKHQISNCILAICVLEKLTDLGFSISTEQMLAGLKKAEWQGRFSILAQNPLFLIDGAHNEDAAEKLAESIQMYFTNKKIIYIMGVLRDKEYEKIIKATYSFAAHIITVTTPNNPRAMHAYDLAQVVKEYHPSVTVADSLEEAVEVSYLLADKDSVILAFGSLSYLGDLSRIVEKRNELRFQV